MPKQGSAIFQIFQPIVLQTVYCPHISSPHTFPAKITRKFVYKIINNSSNNNSRKNLKFTHEVLYMCAHIVFKFQPCTIFGSKVIAIFQFHEKHIWKNAGNSANIGGRNLRKCSAYAPPSVKISALYHHYSQRYH